MKLFWRIIYNTIVIYPLIGFFRLFGKFNEKVKKGLDGREDLIIKLKSNLSKLDESKPTVWVHASSMGEFEQAKPVIEEIKNNIGCNVIATFFSPSGYENQKNYAFADIKSYLPLDTRKDASEFIDVIKPSTAIFIRYDIWPNHIWELEKRKIPVFLIDATMKETSPRLLPVVKSFHDSIFKSFSKIITISESDRENFLKFSISPEKVFAAGDTRFDRVYKKCMDAGKTSLLPEHVTKDKTVLVTGSSWEEDEENYLQPVLEILKSDPQKMLIVVPHEPTHEHIESLKSRIDMPSVLYTEISNYNNEQVIIVNIIGVLLTLYKYASIAYVGGSFKQGIHNVLEPAVYNIPVVYGPKIENSQEAIKLANIGGGIVINNSDEAKEVFAKLFNDKNYRESTGNLAGNFVKENIGATKAIYNQVKVQLN